MSDLKEMDKAFEMLKSSYKKLREQLLKNKHNAQSNWCIGVSAGHGGIYNNKYYTQGKLFDHGTENMHIKGVFYEGVFNRIIADKFCKRLRDENMVYEKFYHEYEDWELPQKTDMINHHHVNVKPVITFDLHSNASKYHNARGFSVYTSPGQTYSDKIATILFMEVEKISNKFGFKLRSETYHDGDVDYEARFWMCTKTAGPSVLCEALFFDNIKDAKILMLESFQDAYVECLLYTAVWADQNIPLWN